jgi:hypothetical protein
MKTCKDCRGEIVEPKESGPAGYAITPDGSTICYGCADKRTIAELKDRTRPMGAYLSSDGARATTWTGGTLGAVVWSRPCRLTRLSFTHSKSSFRSVNVRDVHGGMWYGRGSPGVCITLRPMKG